MGQALGCFEGRDTAAGILDSSQQIAAVAGTNTTKTYNSLYIEELCHEEGNWLRMCMEGDLDGLKLLEKHLIHTSYLAGASIPFSAVVGALEERLNQLTSRGYQTVG